MFCLKVVKIKVSEKKTKHNYWICQIVMFMHLLKVMKIQTTNLS